MKSIVPFGLVLLAVGCASTGTPRMLGPATDTPERFQFLEVKTGAALPVPPDAACENPLLDPRDGVQLVLVRASDGLGDYEPSAPRYGLSRYELLRVDCSTGVATGRVSR